MSGRAWSVSFRARFVGAIAVVNLITLGAAFVGVKLLVDANEQQRFDDVLHREATEEAHEIANSGGERLQISPRLRPNPDDVGPWTKFALLYTAEGEVLDVTAQWRGEQPAFDQIPTPVGDLMVAGERLRGLVIEIPGHPGTSLLLAAPRRDLDRNSRYLAQVMALVFGFAFVTTLVLSSGVVRRLTRVHQRIAEVARRVSGRDAHARVGRVDGAPEIVQLAHDIDQMIERLELLLEAQSTFIAHAAHELRSPLTSLYGELSHALRRSRDADQYRAAIEEALDATRRLKDLAEDLLALARIGRDRSPPTSLVELGEVCSEAVAMVGSEARARGIRIETRVDPMTVRGDGMDLARLVRNVLENAIRHSPPSGVVELAGRREGDHATLRVRDQGPGITAEDGERIFQPFFRGGQERASTGPGSGLGLAIAREIASHHGGALELQPEAASGACFVLRLPLVR
jgi:two-component system heavy metal sensor histidine kinase CusS